MTYPATYAATYGGGLALDFPAVTVEMMFSGSTWTDVTPYVDVPADSITITRGSTRVESPVVRYEGGTCHIPLDNSDRRFDPSNLAGPYASAGVTLLVPRIKVRVSAVYASVTYRLFNGFADSWNISYSPPSDSVAAVDCSDGFRRLGAQPRPPKASFAGGGEDAGARVTRILNDAAWPAGSRSITAGDSTLQPTLLGGTTPGVVPLSVIVAGGGQTVNVAQSAATSAPLDELQLTAETEMGELYINGNGFLVFRHRNGIYLDARSVTPQAIFGDDPAGSTAELPYASAPLVYDMATMWNGATIANTGGNLQQAADATSQQEPPAGYGPRVYDSQNLLADSDWQAANYAQHIIATSKNPEQRFESLTVDPAASPAALFPQVLGREIGDQITVVRRPPQGTGALPYAQGTVTSPGTFANILLINVTPGAYTVGWSVSLSGTLAAADKNNFGIYNGNTFVTGSLNPAAAGIYAQAPVSFTVAGGTPFIKILSAGNTPTTGAVYGAYIPSPIARDVFIRGVSHTITDSAWATSWILQDATSLPQPFILGDAVNGVLGTSQLGF